MLGGKCVCTEYMSVPAGHAQSWQESEQILSKGSYQALINCSQLIVSSKLLQVPEPSRIAANIEITGCCACLVPLQGQYTCNLQICAATADLNLPFQIELYNRVGLKHLVLQAMNRCVPVPEVCVDVDVVHASDGAHPKRQKGPAAFAVPGPIAVLISGVLPDRYCHTFLKPVHHWIGCARRSEIGVHVASSSWCFCARFCRPLQQWSFEIITALLSFPCHDYSPGTTREWLCRTMR